MFIKMIAKKRKIITMIKGGLGNQLFCYAAARRLAIFNNAELKIDNVTGFEIDKTYKRRYLLHHFNIKQNFASYRERKEPFGRYRHYLSAKLSKLYQFEKRHYIQREMLEFEERLLNVVVKRSVYLDGVWLGENYFKDIEDIIRNDLRIISPKDKKNLEISELIKKTNAVCLHLRWFIPPGVNNKDKKYNMRMDYYQRAIDRITSMIEPTHFFIFSDYPDAVREKLIINKHSNTFIYNNNSEDNCYADLWLMQQCKHFIIANSTFSWWGAWLSNNPDKIVICPDIRLRGITAWDVDGLVPVNWIKIKV